MKKYRILRTSTSFFHPEISPYSKAYQDGEFSDGEPIWCVDIESIEDLNAIIEETRRPIIFDDNTIEIYDDYRE